MKKKTIIIVVGIVLILGVLVAILLPKRIKLYNAIKDNVESLGAEGKMFEFYDVSDSSLTQIETDYLTIGIPGDFTLGDSDVIEIYKSADGKEQVGISNNVSDEKIAFFDPEYDETSEIFGIEYSFDDLKKGFEKLGYGIPDSTYNTYKCLYLLDEKKDYSFWDYEKGLAYANAAYVKNELAWMDVHYVYEKDDIYALIMEKNTTDDGMIRLYVDVFDPDDLNTSNLVSITVKDRQQAYAIINSIKVK